jgi:hypothetical protein
LGVILPTLPLGVYGFLHLRNIKAPPPNNSLPSLPPSPLSKITLALGTFLLTLSLLAALQRGWLLGLDWDGYAIWQLKAKAFFYDGDMRLLRDSAHFEYAHRDYPLLVPLASYWLYANAGAVWDGAAQCLNLLFYLNILALFYAVARRTTAPHIALLGTALVASLPLAVHHAVSGFADVPFAAYFLAVGVCLLLRAPAPLTAALSVGLLFTKNEGALACLLFLPLLFAASPSPKRNRLAGQLAALGVAFAPWLLFKRAAGIHGDMEANQLSHHAYGTILERVAPTCKAWLMHLAQVGPWYPCWGLLGLLGLAGYLNAKEAQDRVLRLFLLFPLLQACGYTLIYLITPHALSWHLATSMDRLLLHLAPTLLLGALLTCFPTPASE